MRLTAAIAGATLLVAACGSDDAAESGLEELIESQAGGDVDIDLDDGEIRVQTPEGEVKLNSDDGSFSVEVDGEEVVSADVDGEGDGSVEFSGEDGDGSMNIDSSGSVPEDWPAEVPTPDDLTIETGASFESDGQVAYTVTGTADGEEFVAAYSAELEDAGLEQTSSFESDGASYFHEGDDWVATVFGVPSDDGTWDVVINVTTAP